MDFLIAVQAPAFPLSPTEFATESAFAEHLRQLRESMAPEFRRVVLLAPQMSELEYADKKDHLGVLSADRDEIWLIPAHRTDIRARLFWTSEFWSLWRRIDKAVRGAGVVHAGMADDLWRPLMAMVDIVALLQRKPLVFVVDVDFRKHSERYRALGLWSRRSYWINRLVYDPLQWVQVWLGVRLASLALLKGRGMVRDFGRGRSQVRNFYDTVHRELDVLDQDSCARRVDWLRRDRGPLTLIYFGRFVPYKGLDRLVRAVGLSSARGTPVRLTLVGDGESRDDLVRLAIEQDVEQLVRFVPPAPYGPALFEELAAAHLCAFTPLVEDTPRAAFDAFARGLPLVAFDIAYFRDLSEDSGAVRLATWPSAEALATCFQELDQERSLLVNMTLNAVKFARANTQTIWLERRASWIKSLTNAKRGPCSSDV